MGAFRRMTSCHPKTPATALSFPQAGNTPRPVGVVPNAITGSAPHPGSGLHGVPRTFSVEGHERSRPQSIDALCSADKRWLAEQGSPRVCWTGAIMALGEREPRHPNEHRHRRPQQARVLEPRPPGLASIPTLVGFSPASPLIAIAEIVCGGFGLRAAATSAGVGRCKSASSTSRPAWRQAPSNVGSCECAATPIHPN
jgi:hypothetical protein